MAVLIGLTFHTLLKVQQVQRVILVGLVLLVTRVTLVLLVLHLTLVQQALPEPLDLPEQLAPLEPQVLHQTLLALQVLLVTRARQVIQAILVILVTPDLLGLPVLRAYKV